jgi:hypothetical protein
MHPEADIDFNPTGDGEVAVLHRSESAGERGPNETTATKCNPREVREAIGAVLVRSWAVRRSLPDLPGRRT